MTHKMSYWNGIACVLECARQAKRDAAFPMHCWSVCVCDLRSQTERGSVRVSRAVFGVPPNTPLWQNFVFNLIQSNSRLFKPIQDSPPGVYEKNY
jgi:hypothetical protein